jgi:hypothetical protein
MDFHRNVLADNVGFTNIYMNLLHITYNYIFLYAQTFVSLNYLSKVKKKLNEDVYF